MSLSLQTPPGVCGEMDEAPPRKQALKLSKPTRLSRGSGRTVFWVEASTPYWPGIRGALGEEKVG